MEKLPHLYSYALMLPLQKFTYCTNHSDPILAKLAIYPRIVEAALISERYSTKGNLRKIAGANSSGCLVISDNGNFSRMSKVARRFAARGKSLLKLAEKAFAENGKIGDELHMKKELLLEEITTACQIELEKTPLEKIVTKQMSCSPDYLIGLEDFVIPVATMVGLFRPVFESDPMRILTFQQNTLDLYMKQKAGYYGFEEELELVRKYLVLHSYDYASAMQGAKNCLTNDVEGIAISFGGPMATRTYLSEIQIGAELRKFSEKLPESYLIAIAIIAGATKGFRTKKVPIHILGLGSPILIVLLGYFLRKSLAVSIDATSTFKDADDGKIYSMEPAFMKLDMYKVAAYGLVDNKPYSILNPFFVEFESRYPSDWAGIRKELNVTNDTDPRQLAKDLKASPALLEKYIPYFTPMRKGRDPLIKAVKTARGGSNYWVLKQICEQVRALDGDQVALKNWVSLQAAKYASIASPKWSKAVSETLQWIDLYDL